MNVSVKKCRQLNNKCRPARIRTWNNRFGDGCDAISLQAYLWSLYQKENPRKIVVCCEDLACFGLLSYSCLSSSFVFTKSASAVIKLILFISFNWNDQLNVTAFTCTWNNHCIRSPTRMVVWACNQLNFSFPFFRYHHLCHHLVPLSFTLSLLR